MQFMKHDFERLFLISSLGCYLLMTKIKGFTTCLDICVTINFFVLILLREY